MTGEIKPPSPPTYRIHPATTITNIKNHIPIVLGTEEGNYNNWVALFKVQCTVCKVLDHIIPPDAAPSEHDEEWLCLDAIVLQWIYSTITTDLLTTILHPDNTAHKAWQALQGIFIDNKPTRAIYLQQKFSNTKLAAFPDATAYCRELKLLSDQLSNVDAPITDQSLVLQLISGLSSEFDNLATTLQQKDALPSFTAARTALLMEESRKAQQQPTAAVNAAVVQPPLQVRSSLLMSPTGSINEVLISIGGAVGEDVTAAGVGVADATIFMVREITLLLPGTLHSSPGLTSHGATLILNGRLHRVHTRLCL